MPGINKVQPVMETSNGIVIVYNPFMPHGRDSGLLSHAKTFWQTMRETLKKSYFSHIIINIEMFGAPCCLKWAFYLPLHKHSPSFWLPKSELTKNGIHSSNWYWQNSLIASACFVDIWFFFSSEKWRNKYKLSLWLIYGLYHHFFFLPLTLFSDFSDCFLLVVCCWAWCSTKVK